ncbi:MAG TPA: PAS domain-containing sensor histidine kinase [Gemmatimonadaceae bacterium]|nr:PAS domain-containing sensor histidine kinase [Gemmatimonadaceae bacterium]
MIGYPSEAGTVHLAEEGMLHVHAILAHMGEAFLAVDRQLHVLSASEAAAGWAGVAPAAMLGRHVLELFPDAGDLPFIPALQAALEERREVEVEAYYPRLHTWFAMRAFPVVEGAAVFATDVTERHRVEEWMQRSERALASLVEHSPDYIARFDASLRYLYVSPSITRVMHRPSGEFLGRRMPELDIPAEVCAQWEAQIRGVFETGDAAEFTSMYVRPDGQQRYYQARLVPEHDEAGRVRTVLGFTRDFTELREATEQLRAAGAELERRVAERTRELAESNAQLAEATRHKSEFLASVSHGLRTPLNAVIGFTELLHEEKVGALTSAQRELLAEVLDGAQELRAQIDELLDTARAESGRLQLEWTTVSPARVVRDVRDTLRALAAERQLRMHLDVKRAPRVVRTDARLLRQAVLDLASNALKFTPAGGTVTLRTIADSRQSFRVEVEDTGVGIATQDQARLFQAFTQIGPPHDDAARRGSGLGLALTRTVAEALGGSVGVRSAPGRGSCFFLDLPRAPSPDVNLRDRG